MRWRLRSHREKLLTVIGPGVLPSGFLR
jgi:hypothetical protein